MRRLVRMAAATAAVLDAEKRKSKLEEWKAKRRKTQETKEKEIEKELKEKIDANL